MSVARSTDSGGGGRVLQLHDVAELAERGLKAFHGPLHHIQQRLHGVGSSRRLASRQFFAQGLKQPFDVGNGRFEVVRGGVDEAIEVGVSADELLIGRAEFLISPI